MKRDPSPALHLGSAIFLLAMAMVFVGAGCGAAASTNAEVRAGEYSPQQPPPPAPTRLETVGDAEALLANGEYDIRLALGPDKREYQGQFAQPPATPAGEARSATAADAADRKPKDAEEKVATAAAGGTPAPPAQQATSDSTPGASASPCVTACKALASMDRAASHICSLAGSDDSRCTNARERVRSATERVRQNCSDCGS